MKYSFLIFFGAMVFASCDTKKADQQAMMAASKDSTTVQLIDSFYNFGTIAEGEKVIHNFSFKNTGNKPLVVSNAQATCGCTVPEKPERPIAPGETGIIKVVFDSHNKEGHQEKGIRVSANVKPFFGSLRLMGEVKKKA